MKHLEDILLLGDPRLYEHSAPILKSELHLVESWVADLHNVMEEIRNRYNFGRAIAAPQLGIMKRLVYMNIDKPMIFINPEIEYIGKDQFELWDDCMSFPHLLVKVKRHKNIKVKYRDIDWQDKEWLMKDDLSELLQHEVDHLDGILCTMRALNEKSFKYRT